MESRLGHDFSRVRVHTDAQAAESAGALNAHAYTVGADVAFAAGEYAPETDAGQRLLAHELAHVAQQDAADRDGGGATELPVRPSDDAAEMEAKSAGDHVARGESVAVHNAVGPSVQRSEDEHGIMPTIMGAFSALHGATELPHAAVLPSVVNAGEAGAGIFPRLSSFFGAGEASLEAGQGLYAAGEAAHHMPGGGPSNWLGPLAMLAGGYEMYHNTLGTEHMNLQNTGAAVAGAAELGSGAIGTMGLAGSLTGSAGLSSAAASLGPLGAVLGAGAAGYGVGTMIAENTGVDEAIGDTMFDVLGPEPGLWLADNLPSWLQ